MKHSKWIFLFLFLICRSSFGITTDSALVSPEVHTLPLTLSSLNSFETRPGDLSSLNNKTNLSFDPLKTEVNYYMLGGMGAAFLGVGTYIHIYQQNAWWKNERTKFHFKNDWNYSLWIDKVGHFYGTNILAHAFSGGYDAANMTAEQSAIFSAASALLFELYVETEDGFASEWGFSPGDAAGDALGALFYLGQYYYPFLKNFQPKWSYWPTNKMRDNPNQIIIDDYEGQIYWMSMRVNNFLPRKAEVYWPDFLNIAVGMGVKQLDGSGGGHRELYISLDLDAEELPLHGPVWQFVKNSLNYFHFPMPGLRITPDATFFVFCF